MYPSYYHSKEIFISDPDAHRMTLPQWSMLNRALPGVWTVGEKAVSSLPLTWLLYIWLLPFVRDKTGLAVSRNLSIQPIQSNDSTDIGTEAGVAVDLRYIPNVAHRRYWSPHHLGEEGGVGARFVRSSSLEIRSSR